jgi:hypothetical protein
MEDQMNAVAQLLDSSSIENSAVKIEDVINICKTCHKMLTMPIRFDNAKFGGTSRSVSGLSNAESMAKYYSQDYIQLSMQKGCPLCYQIDYILSKAKADGRLNHDVDLKDININQELFLYDDQNPNKVIRNLLMRQVGMFSFRESVSIRTVSSPTIIPRAWYQPALDIESTASFDVNPWYQKCLRDHECEKDRNKEGDKWYLPPRVLRYDNTSVQLVETNELDLSASIPRYACLSYSWGSAANHLKLSTENIELYKSGIPLSDLPDTFGDTVQIARKLGIPYIWIDSLCIIQFGDKEVDRHHQLKQMDNIYASCVLQIAAAHSVDAKGGCFSIRPRGAAYPPVIPPPVLVGSDHLPKELVDSTQRVSVALPSSLPFMEFYLSSRGWVYQERLLSPRTLHFDKHAVYWECHECVDSSSFPITEAVSKEIQVDDIGYFQRRAYDWRCGYDFDPHWYAERIQTYSTCSLTNLNDHLVAFSALARRICNLYQDEYLAGFPVSLLPRVLCWARSLTTADKPDPAFYIAPTWSWASIFDPVYFYDWPPDSRTETTVLETNVVLNPRNATDKFGEIIFASITLEGPVLSLSIKPSEEDEFNLAGNILSIEARTDDVTDELYVHSLYWASRIFNVRLDRKTDNLKLEDYCKWTYLVIETSITRQNTLQRNKYCGLVLHEKEKGKWVRLGFWTLEFAIEEVEGEHIPLLDRTELHQLTVI